MKIRKHEKQVLGRQLDNGQQTYQRPEQYVYHIDLPSGSFTRAYIFNSFPYSHLLLLLLLFYFGEGIRWRGVFWGDFLLS